MPVRLAVFGLGILLSLSVQAASEDRMATCSKEAAGLVPRERDNFMRACIAGEDTNAIRSSPQERMKECTRLAEEKVGEERRAFISSCLKR
jgi:hypothetical protein